jgi:hypothetical protein
VAVEHVPGFHAWYKDLDSVLKECCTIDSGMTHMCLFRHWYTDPDSMFNGRYTFDGMSAARDAHVFASEYAVFDWGIRTIPRGNIQARDAGPSQNPAANPSSIPAANTPHPTPASATTSLELPLPACWTPRSTRISAWDLGPFCQRAEVCVCACTTVRSQ